MTFQDQLYSYDDEIAIAREFIVILENALLDYKDRIANKKTYVGYDIQNQVIAMLERKIRIQEEILKDVEEARDLHISGKYCEPFEDNGARLLD